jgi:hypothetical protein
MEAQKPRPTRPTNPVVWVCCAILLMVVAELLAKDLRTHWMDTMREAVQPRVEHIERSNERR